MILIHRSRIYRFFSKSSVFAGA